MKQIIHFLSEPLVGTMLGVTGVALAIYFYTKSKQVARISRYFEEVAVIGSSTAAFDNNLEIRFDGELVNRVTKSRAYLWNSGNTTIDGERIAKSDPLRFENGVGNEILKIELVRQSRDVSNVTFETRGKNAVLVSFDFFDPNDGFVVDVVHTGGRRSLHCKGTVRGIPDGVNDSGRRTSLDLIQRGVFVKAIRTFAGYGSGITALLGLFIVALGLFRENFKEYGFNLNAPIGGYSGPSWPLVFIGVLYAIIPAGTLWMRRRRFPRSLEIKQGSTD